MSEFGDPFWTPMIYNRALMANNLAILAKNKTMITVSLGGKDTILTALIDVNLKTGVIIFDTSPSEKLNTKLLSLTRRGIKFSTVFNGIQVAFTGKSVRQGKFSGFDTFVMPFPASLYWLDRRGAFRVNAPKTINTASISIAIAPPDEKSKAEYKVYYEKAIIKIRQQLVQKIEDEYIEEQAKFEKAYAAMLPEEKKIAQLERDKYEEELKRNPILPDENLVNVIQLKLFDISITGCSAINIDDVFSYFLNVKSLCDYCTLYMPDQGVAEVTLEIMTKRNFELDPENEYEKKETLEELVGFKFIEPKQSAESDIFIYIQALDRIQKQR